jgi:hypothetical protein
MSKKPNSVTREQAKEITAEIHQAVSAVLKKHGLDIESSKSMFGDWYEFKVRACQVKKVNGVNVESIIAKQWILEAWYYGFSEEQAQKLLGTPFIGKKVNGQEIVLAGYNARKQKMPFIGQTADGKQYELPADVAKSLSGYTCSWSERAAQQAIVNPVIKPKK